MRSAATLLATLALACTVTPTPAPSPAQPIAQLEPEPTRAEIPVLGLELGLPEPPEFFVANPPVLREDGTWSILGLRSVLAEMLPEADAGRMVLVDAYVQEVYAPPVCSERESCPLPKQPHAWLVDEPGVRSKQSALMVIGYTFPIPEWDTESLRVFMDSPEIELVPGRHYVFMGWFRRFSESGFAHDHGLLELFAVTDAPLRDDARWICPRAGRFHPKSRAMFGLAPIEPELAHAPSDLKPGAQLPEPGPLVEPGDRREAFTLGRAAAWTSDPRRADYYYRWTIVADPSAASGWVELGNLYVDNGEPEAGLAILDLAIARSPDDAALHTGRGRLLLNVDNPAAAIASYRRALELEPDKPDALFGLGMAYAEVPDRGPAIAALRRFLEVMPDAPDHILRAAEDTILRMDMVQ